MDPNILVIRGPRPPEAPSFPIVLDSPHSGWRMPADFGGTATVEELREGEDSFVDELWLPAATQMGIPLLMAQFPRTYIDVNRHTGDIDRELLAEPCPWPVVDSGKAKIGKALIWRMLDKGKPIYNRKLGIDEVRKRIEGYHQPYYDALWELLANAHTRFGTVYHINCHSMGRLTTADIEGADGQPRPDFVLGDRDSTTCEPAFTAFIQKFLEGQGYSVAVNKPFKGMELVRAYSDPAAGRHSLQIEINTRLYMKSDKYEKNEDFAKLQSRLMTLLHQIGERFGYAQTMIRPRRG
jgi:N-formylglutamate amidohydrolase